MADTLQQKTSGPSSVHYPPFEVSGTYICFMDTVVVHARKNDHLRAIVRRLEISFSLLSICNVAWHRVIGFVSM